MGRPSGPLGDTSSALQAWEGVRYKFSACASNSVESNLAENRTRPRPPVGMPLLAARRSSGSRAVETTQTSQDNAPPFSLPPPDFRVDHIECVLSVEILALTA